MALSAGSGWAALNVSESRSQPSCWPGQGQIPSLGSVGGSPGAGDWKARFCGGAAAEAVEKWEVKKSICKAT